MAHRAGGEHLGIEQRPARQKAMEEPAVPVSPFHHRRDTEPMSLIYCHFSRSLSPLGRAGADLRSFSCATDLSRRYTIWDDLFDGVSIQTEPAAEARLCIVDSGLHRL
jgi:hypothetical protein